MKKLVLLSVFFIFAITTFSEVPNEISDNGVLRSYKNIPRGKVQLNFKTYDKTDSWTKRSILIYLLLSVQLTPQGLLE